MKILVVDDDFVTRTKLLTLLEPYGHCDGAQNGDEALKKFKDAHEKSEPFKLITMDIDMPGMNGHEVVEKIRNWESENNSYENSTEAKILMVTSMQSRTDLIGSFSEGCEWFLKKPITPEDLEESLAKISIPKPISSS